MTNPSDGSERRFQPTRPLRCVARLTGTVLLITSPSFAAHVGDAPTRHQRTTDKSLAAAASASASGNRNATGDASASGNRNATGDASASGNRNATGDASASGNRNATGDAAAVGSNNVTAPGSASGTGNHLGDTTTVTAPGGIGIVNGSIINYTISARESGPWRLPRPVAGVALLIGIAGLIPTIAVPAKQYSDFTTARSEYRALPTETTREQEELAWSKMSSAKNDADTALKAGVISGGVSVALVLMSVLLWPNESAESSIAMTNGGRELQVRF
jgi:hypothetical protein